MNPGRNFAGPFCRRIFLAEDLIEHTCRQALDSVGLLPSQPEPIRIDRFIFLRFGIEEEFESLPERVIGCAKFTLQGLRRIIVSRELAEADDPISRVRVRSTLAHEAGHGLLHEELFIEKINLESNTPLMNLDDGIFDSVSKDSFLCRAEFGVQDVPKFEWWEYQANLAMAALLLPKHLVIEAARALLPEVISGPGAFEERVAEAERQMSETFHVSRKMIEIRMGKWWLDHYRQPSLFEAP